MNRHTRTVLSIRPPRFPNCGAIIAALALVALLAPPIRAAVIYDSISRIITARATSVAAGTLGDSTPGTWHDSLFVFNPAVDNPAIVNPDTTITLSGGGGYAVQSSSLGTATMQGHFLAKAWDGLSGFEGGATSTLTVLFTLTEPTPCTLTGSWATNYSGVQGPSFGGRVALASTTTTLADGHYTFPNNTGALNFNSLLAPGQYTLTVEARYEFIGISPLNANQMIGVDFNLYIPASGDTSLSACALILLTRRTRRLNQSRAA